MSHHCAGRSNSSLLSPTRDPDKLLHGPNITNQTWYQTVRLSRESFGKETKARALCTKELERVYSSKIEKYGDQHGDERIDCEILDSYILREEQRGGTVVDSITGSKVERLMEDNIKTAVEVKSTCVIIGIMEVTIDNKFMVGCDEYKE